jgi:two-component system, NarL family, nitrate/nitrite response regulator NarL
VAQTPCGRHGASREDFHHLADPFGPHPPCGRDNCADTGSLRLNCYIICYTPEPRGQPLCYVAKAWYFDSGTLMSSTRVVIADRSPIFLRGLRGVLREDGGFDVVASCCGGVECIQAIRNLSPDIALVDISIPGVSGILAAATFEGSCTRVILLIAAVEAQGLVTAEVSGAYGVVTKEAPPELLIGCLRQAAAGHRISPLPSKDESRQQQGRSAPKRNEINTLAALTERERQIVQLVSEGLSNKEIGRRLDISDGTIKAHLHNIYDKLAINNRTTLAALAISR